MRSPSLLPVIVALLTLALACGEPIPSDQPSGSASIADLPDHKVSELAGLMREMTAFADSTRQRLLRGDELPPYPEHFKRMLTAESTPGMVDHRTYDPFAISYLRQLDSLYSAVPAHRQQAFDELIQYCAACHGQVCPGPLVRINKLRMPA